MGSSVDKQTILNILNNPEAKEFLKKNDLDGLYEYFCNQFGDDYKISSYIDPLVDILVCVGGIKPLKYIKSLAWYKIPIYYIQTKDLRYYTNIKRIDISGFEGKTFTSDYLILPDSIEIIEENAFTNAHFRDWSGLKIFTKSLKRIGNDALSIAEGPLRIDTEKFDSSDPEFNAKVQDYLKSKGISYSYA